MDTATYAVIGSTFVGLGGLLVGAWGVRATIRAQAAEGEAAREHERLVARDARVFDRRADAYVAMMRFCEIHLQTVETIFPTLSPAPTAPHLPSDVDEVEALARASFSTFASLEGDDAFQSFVNQVKDFHVCAEVYARVKDQGSDAEPAFNEMDEARGEVRIRFRELQAQIRSDLNAV